jgi:hypothetical protein
MLHVTVVYHNSFLAGALKLARHRIAPGFGSTCHEINFVSARGEEWYEDVGAVSAYS